MSKDSRLAPLRSSGRLLARILDEPNLVAAVQSLPPRALGKLIGHVGLEDAGEIITLATTAQLTSIFDDDLWRSPKPGKDESFDADRFTLWLEVMLEAGEEFAAGKLAELSEDLVTLAFHKNVLVIDIEEMAVSMSSRASEHPDDEDTQLEKALESCLAEELGPYRIIARHHERWDTLFGLLVALDRDHHEFLQRLLERLCALDADFIEENGGLYEVLSAEESLESDVGADREDRRAEQGFIAPSSAVAFLALARTTKLDDLIAAEAQDPITRAYFRQLRTSPETKAKASTTQKKPLAQTSSPILDLLHEAEVLPNVPSAQLLEAQPTSKTDANAFMVALRQLGDESPSVHANRMRELAYLANVLSAGCTLAGRSMRPVEAVPAAVAACNLALEHLVERDESRSPLAILATASADKLFAIAWNILFHEITLPAAAAAGRLLAQAQAHTTKADSQALGHAATALRSAVASGKPWLALRSLDPLADQLGPAKEEALSALLDECPTLAGALKSPEERDVTFIASRAQILAAQTFLAHGLGE